MGIHASAMNARSRRPAPSLALDAKNAPSALAVPPTKMIASALPATSAVIAHKSSEHPMTTNKSGAVKSFHSVFMKAHAFANASSRPSRRHALATRTQNVTHINAPPPLASNSLAANKITMTNDKMIDASIAPALGGRPGALSVPERSANSAVAAPPSAPTTICVGAFHAVVPPEPPLPAISAHIPNPTMQ